MGSATKVFRTAVWLPGAREGLGPYLKGNRILVGSKQLRKALKAGTVLTVFLARNADPGVTEPIADLCQAADIQPIWVDSMKELGRSCGIDVGTAAAAVLKP